MEIFARELSGQLAERGWSSALCFLSTPPRAVRDFLELPNVTLEQEPGTFEPSLAVLRRMRKLLAKHRPEVFHLHMGPFVSPYPWLARLAGVRKVYLTDHFSHPAGFVPMPYRWWKRLAVRAINGPLTEAICVSQYNRQCMIAKQGLPAERVSCLYNGIDLARAKAGLVHGKAFRLRHGIPADRVMILQVSWLIPEKGVDDLVRAMQLVVQRNANTHLVLAGDGPLRGELESLARSLGIAGHVSFTGVVGDPLAEGLFAAADVCCQVSQWEEAFGLAIAEAMATGRPMIGTRVGGIPELIDDGVNGYLVNRGDVAGIAERMLQLVADPGVRAAMGERGRQICSQRFDVRHNVTSLLDKYQLHERPACAAVSKSGARMKHAIQSGT